MYNPLKAVAVVISAMLLCSCNDGIDINIEERSYQTDTCESKIKVPEFSCAAASEFAETVNSIYNKEISVLVDRLITQNADSENRTELSADTNIMLNNGRIVSTVLEGEVFSGGAHGEKFRISKTFDFAEGKEITLDSLFSDDAWKTVVNNKMQKLAELGEGEYAQLWEMPSAEKLKSENFYLKNNELILYFPPYELSYYRRGYVEFEFKKEELAGYLSEYGREVL